MPRHHLPEPLREGSLVRPQSHSALLAAATRFVTSLVERYRGRPSIAAWQLEHEAVDPLGNEHVLARRPTSSSTSSGRCAAPILAGRSCMNGFLPTSLPVAPAPAAATRDQGDSLVVAESLADIVGVDYHPRHALLDLGPLTLYLDGSRSPWQARRRRRIQARVEESGRRMMVSEGQAEPWEAVTSRPARGAMHCSAATVIGTYDDSLRGSEGGRLSAYLFWGAEYWVRRRSAGDGSYLDAFERVLEES